MRGPSEHEMDHPCFMMDERHRIVLTIRALRREKGLSGRVKWAPCEKPARLAAWS